MDNVGSAAQAMAHQTDSSVSIPIEHYSPAADMHFLLWLNRYDNLQIFFQFLVSQKYVKGES